MLKFLVFVQKSSKLDLYSEDFFCISCVKPTLDITFVCHGNVRKNQIGTVYYWCCAKNVLVSSKNRERI